MIVKDGDAQSYCGSVYVRCKSSPAQKVLVSDLNMMDDVMTNLKSECPMRNKQGNCCPVGGFCADAVPDEICRAVRSAYERGYSDAVTYLNDLNMKQLKGLCKECAHRNSCPDAKRNLEVTGCSNFKQRKKSVS